MSVTRIYTVSQLTKSIKRVLEDSFGSITLQGEISNFKRHSSGHIYFTLKDEFAQIQAVLWRSRVQSLKFMPQDGMKVLVRGSVTVYELRGSYQIDVSYLEALGAGELQLAFERLKQKLAAEGLFDRALKRPLPRFPMRIGIITSPTGAALQDILNILNRRCPAVTVTICPVKVQGTEAAAEISEAIKAFNDYAEIDVIILTRGGGSLEDLWAFNEEIVARAIHKSRIPIISAVGHEIDYTISDFVADLRAPTPSAAAELVIPTTSEMVEFVRNFQYTGSQYISESISLKRERINALLRSYALNKPFDLIRQFSQRLDELKRGLEQGINHKFTLLRQSYTSLVKRMASVDPATILRRGYSLVYRDNHIIAHPKELHPSNEITIRFHEGEVQAEVTNHRKEHA